MKVKFLPIEKEFDINPNESVLELAKRTGVFIKSICGGLPSCSECRIKIVSGEHNIMPPNFKEKALIGSAYFVDHSRLSCQVKCMGDITVDVSEQLAKEHAQPASKKPRMPMKYNRRESAHAQKPLITEVVSSTPAAGSISNLASSSVPKPNPNHNPNPNLNSSPQQVPKSLPPQNPTSVAATPTQTPYAPFPKSEAVSTGPVSEKNKSDEN